MKASAPFSRSLAGVLISCLFLSFGLEAQPTATPAPRTRRFQRPIGAEIARVQAGAIEGRVTDSSGAPLPGATCRARSSELNVSRDAVADSTGLCRISLLPAGTYRVEAFHTGLGGAPTTVTVSLGQTTAVHITLSRVIIYTLPRVALPTPPPPVESAPTHRESAPPPPPPPTAPPESAPPPPPEATSPPMRNGHPPGTTPAAPGIRAMYWNSWIQNKRSEQAVPKIDVDELYNLNFDLAAFNYSTFRNAPATGSVSVDPAFREELDRYSGRTATIHVKPVLGGRGLRFLGTSEESRPVEIKLARLRTPPTDWTPDDPLADVSDKVRAAQVQIAVKAEEPGCASVGLSIWNEERERPIDYLVRHFQVGGGGNDPSCVGRDLTRPLRGNMISLLALDPDDSVDAALHIFEMGDRTGTRSYAVFASSGGPVRSWVLPQQLSDYVTKTTGGLLDRLAVARSRSDYGLLARELRSVLFRGDPGQSDADAALAVLRDLAQRPKRPSVFIRLADIKGRNLFLPLGLTEIESGKVLGEVANVTQPLPRETYSGGGRCIGTWKMVLPDNLGTDVSGSYLTPVRSPMSNRTSSWPDLESYLSESAGVAAQPEGLLLLAHQAGGRIWFIPDTPSSLLSQNISRKFARGSVAVLAACSVGALNEQSSGASLLEALNVRGVDAVVLSPFAVRGTVGARFAFHFADEVMKAQEAREGVALVELFRRATEETKKDAKIASERNGVYEFLLAGNGGLRLCQ